MISDKLQQCSLNNLVNQSSIYTYIYIYIYIALYNVYDKYSKKVLQDITFFDIYLTAIRKIFG